MSKAAYLVGGKKPFDGSFTVYCISVLDDALRRRLLDKVCIELSLLLKLVLLMTSEGVLWEHGLKMICFCPCIVRSLGDIVRMNE